MIILASGSPRRKELLSLITDKFLVEPSSAEEIIDESIPLFERPQYLAQLKAKNVFENNHHNDVVIGCDTGVFINSQMLGKPKDKTDAQRLLKLLSGTTHKVVTGCSIICNKISVNFSQTTEVEFYSLTENEILRYITTGEPMDKAGAYGIQGKGGLFVKKIAGDYFNVVGLPVAMLYQKLKALGISFT